MSLSNDEIRDLFIGKFVTITKSDDSQERGQVVDLIGAFNLPNLACGFILSDRRHIGFGSIKTIEIEF